MEKAKVIAPELLKTDFEPYCAPIPTHASLDIPMLWVIAADDMTAPPGPTLVALARLRGRGQRFETIDVPHAGHGMTQVMKRGSRRFDSKDGRRILLDDGSVDSPADLAVAGDGQPVLRGVPADREDDLRRSYMRLSLLIECAIALGSGNSC